MACDETSPLEPEGELLPDVLLGNASINTLCVIFQDDDISNQIHILRLVV